MSKRCTRCFNVFTLDCFHKDKTHNDGYRSACRDCQKIKYKKWYKNNKEKVAKHQANKREYQNVKQKESRQRLYEENPKRLELEKIRCYIKDSIKYGTECKYLGIPMYLYCIWLESNFDKNMNWGNRNTYWQIDHTIPYYMLDENEGFNWSNTFPMKKDKNNSKNNCIDINLCLERQKRVNEFKRVHYIE